MLEIKMRLSACLASGICRLNTRQFAALQQTAFNTSSAVCAELRFIALALIALAAPTLAAEPIIGRPSVTDGDTLVIRDIRIRLHGVDAPESAQTCEDAVGKTYRCGQRAALALAEKIGQANVACEPRDKDQYGRTVAVCRLGSEDLNAWLVAQGYAAAYRRYGTDYVPQEDMARTAKRGLWAGVFEPPSDWRRGRRRAGHEERPEKVPPAPSAPVEQAACTIKGNISRKGEKIYHLAGSRDYERTQITEASGERMFCSEEEAKAAGWRPANSR